MLALVIFIIVILAGLIWTLGIEPRWFELNRYDVSLRKVLPRPLKILHLSDSHFAWRKPYLDRFFDRLAAEDVDLIVVSGDIVDCPEGIPLCVENFRKLKSRFGILAVLGNHDYFNYGFLDVILHNFPGQQHPVRRNAYHDIQRSLEETGVRVLKNETVEVQFFGTSLLVHGLDDPTTGRANVRKAMQHFDPAKVNILLTHTVDVFLDIGKKEIDLSFSGHSHGGQICLPLIGPIITHTTMGRPYASGIKHLQGAICSISRGMSTGRAFPARLLCRPEAIILTVYGKTRKC